jgi:hypothetical protein
MLRKIYATNFFQIKFLGLTRIQCQNGPQLRFFILTVMLYILKHRKHLEPREYKQTCSCTHMFDCAGIASANFCAVGDHTNHCINSNVINARKLIININPFLLIRHRDLCQ